MKRSTEVERARATLRHLVELSGMSRREVMQRLAAQGSRTDLPRVLSGRLALKLLHVVDIAGALGLHPLEFFGMVWKEPAERSPLLLRLDELFGRPGQPSRGAAPVGSPEADLRQLVARLAREVELLKAAAQKGRHGD